MIAASYDSIQLNEQGFAARGVPVRSHCVLVPTSERSMDAQRISSGRAPGPCATRMYTLTEPAWPRRCTRSSACSTSAALGGSSANTTTEVWRRKLKLKLKFKSS